MNGLGKLPAAVLIFVLVISLAQPVISRTAMSDVEVCESLGILKGIGNGLTPEYLASAPTRIQAAIMFLRLKGLEEKAITYQGQDNFWDLGKMWQGGRAMLAYLKANPELGWLGDGSGRFRPLEKITRREYAKVLLTALGYEQGRDFEWDNVNLFANDIGLTASNEVQNGFTVKDLASATVKAMNTNVKDSEQILLAVLVDDGIVPAQKAEATGLYTSEPDSLKITGVSAVSLLQLEIDFNRKITVASAKNKSHYAVRTENSPLIVPVMNAEILLDQKAVVLTLDTTLPPEVKLDLTVEGIEDLNGNRLSKMEFKGIETMDSTPPQVLGAELNENTVRITFSEPVIADRKDLYEVNDGKISIDEITTSDSRMEATLKLTSVPEQGSITVRVSGNVKDYAGYNLKPKVFTLELP